MRGRVLIVAGSDSGGGAGIQADIKTVTALGGYAMTAVTALTAQNTTGVEGIFEIPADFVAQQMCSVLDDIGADAIKVGMLHRVDVIIAVSEVLEKLPKKLPLIVDPVMVAKGGAVLLEESAKEALMRYIIPKADLVTPNIVEAQELAGKEVKSLIDGEELVSSMNNLGSTAIFLTGGHLENNTISDYFRNIDGSLEIFKSKRIQTTSTHGTGCTAASAIATGIAQGLSMRESILRALNYVYEAINKAPGFGSGHGPLNHAHTIKPF
ncbi:MAG: Hydroxymethylpyrimidine/phosphomethylpyrimidine kinase [Alphaproteobacteria bacterium MarineAlpha3_Bin5]|nr:bifunctional hydroxymethylpyrimidine kinase/phosphomethylpyrimidine kinase [Magnetovibrio sp.]PPR77665.1 MAG: Hydroxymethylpyrimidine/phosphomethylpyrimidine kinase [Alphaproteobacteria bacterium MarineAlpha3_Bin5]